LRSSIKPVDQAGRSNRPIEPVDRSGRSNWPIKLADQNCRASAASERRPSTQRICHGASWIARVARYVGSIRRHVA
jgi:hypothetical protein